MKELENLQNIEKIPEWNEKLVKEFTETSECAVMYPKFRMNYLKSVQKYIEKALHNKKLKFEMNDDEMRVFTTKQTRDPCAIISGDEMINLLSKGFCLEDAMKVLEDDIYSDIVKVNNLCAAKTLENRKSRLQNPSVIKALELLTKTKILVLNKIVGIIGEYDGIEVIKNVVIDCFQKNIHPAYKIKELMIKKNLSKDDVKGNWDRFLPDIKK
ncbi:KRR1 [Hepatospora eriocheir]|uniref:KRR-R motif-containing protein 1 n=1 Tax=Hepatospora eriocheir TaxID=1081669 RepID=A0A1X0QK15_9MICR|nr:KRR1 [Hepatospora eriocheir]